MMQVNGTSVVQNAWRSIIWQKKYVIRYEHFSLPFQSLLNLIIRNVGDETTFVCSSILSGSGICVMSKASVTAKNVTITNNTANEGGCIYLSDNATYEMDGGDYSGNTCTA